jgi:hypothetical protein
MVGPAAQRRALDVLVAECHPAVIERPAIFARRGPSGRKIHWHAARSSGSTNRTRGSPNTSALAPREQGNRETSMKLLNRSAMGFVAVALMACTRRDPLTPAELHQEEAEGSAQQSANLHTEQTAEQTALKRIQSEEQIDMKAAQLKEAAEAEAQIDKQRVELQADRAKFDADLKARLDKVDLRLSQIRPRVSSARADMKTKTENLAKLVADQRTALEKSRKDLPGIAAEKWDSTKRELESNASTLEDNVDELERYTSR